MNERSEIVNRLADEETIGTLLKFYGVLTHKQLILAQNRHVERLQKAIDVLNPSAQKVRNVVREG